MYSKILIVYYSKTNNTKKIGTLLAKNLHAKTEQLIDTKKRHGILGYIISGRDAMKKMTTTLDPTTKNPADYDLIIFGSPVWGWNITPAVRTYLEQHKDKIQNYAFFVTSGNTPSEKITPYFSEILGKDPIAHLGINSKEIIAPDLYNKKTDQFIKEIRK